MAMLSPPLDAGKARLTSCNVAYSLRVSGFESFRWFCWVSFGVSGVVGFLQVVSLVVFCFFCSVFFFVYFFDYLSKNIISSS
jgi:hypothetical protein